MEKVMYLVWKRDAESPRVFREKLLGGVSEQFLGLGAHGLRISVVDEDVFPAGPIRRQSTKPSISGVLSVWLDTALKRKPIEDVIESAVARHAGYLVTESVPLVNAQASNGKRTPGWNQIALLTKPPRLTYEHWMELWQGNLWLSGHTRISLETQLIFGYRQNAIVRPLTYAAPPYDAIAEENFSDEAMTSEVVRRDSVGDDEKFNRRTKIMMEDASKFIDWDKVDVIATSEYTIKS